MIIHHTQTQLYIRHCLGVCAYGCLLMGEGDTCFGEPGKLSDIGGECVEYQGCQGLAANFPPPSNPSVLPISSAQRSHVILVIL